jgi:hypothetical protein
MKVLGTVALNISTSSDAGAPLSSCAAFRSSYAMSDQALPIGSV